MCLVSQPAVTEQDTGKSLEIVVLSNDRDEAARASVGSRVRQESEGQRVTMDSKEGMEHQEEMGVRESVGSRVRQESKGQRVTRDRKDLQDFQEEMV